MVSIVRGGLTMPSSRLVGYITVCEEEFLRIHGRKVCLLKSPIEQLTKNLKIKIPEAPLELINLYSKTRLFIRLKFLNESLEKLSQNQSWRKKFSQHINKFS